LRSVRTAQHVHRIRKAVSKLEARASAAIEAGEKAEGIRQLVAANRLSPDVKREILIRNLRASSANVYGARTRAIFSDEPVTLSYEQGLPTCALADITPEIIRAAFDARGCLYVPKALGRADTEVLSAAVENAHNARLSKKPNPAWYQRLRLPGDDSAPGVGKARGFAHKEGYGCLAVDSPRAMFRICDIYERLGVTAIAEKFLGETPVLSASKFMLWRVGPGSEVSWHQDGRFLGEGMDIASLNVWTALTDCGESAPGMDLVLKKLDHYIQGDEDSHFDWSVSNAQVDELRKSTPVVTPRFRAGDMLMFDHWLLHRTSRQPGMTDTRLAIESWFFAPSVFPLGRAVISA
jgi:hypothetical protein